MGTPKMIVVLWQEEGRLSAVRLEHVHVEPLEPDDLIEVVLVVLQIVPRGLVGLKSRKLACGTESLRSKTTCVWRVAPLLVSGVSGRGCASGSETERTVACGRGPTDVEAFLRLDTVLLSCAYRSGSTHTSSLSTEQRVRREYFKPPAPLRSCIMHRSHQTLPKVTAPVENAIARFENEEGNATRTATDKRRGSSRTVF